MKRFILQRDQDATGVSGTGVVADGAVAPDGRVVMFWRWSAKGKRGKGSMGLYQSVRELREVHGHGGCTRIVWVDPA